MTNGLIPRLDRSSLRKTRRPVGTLRIGVNLVALVSNGGGMRQYVLQLLPWMLRQSPHHFVLFYHWRSHPTIAMLLRRLSRSQRNRVRSVFIVDQAEIFGHGDNFDVYFCPLNCLAPDLLDRPTLTMLPDIQEHFFPQYFTDEQLELRNHFYPRSAHSVTTLLTISRFSQRTICDIFDLDPERVRVVHLAANDEVRSARAAWPSILGELPRRFVLYPANLYPHKNHKVLLDAIRLLAERDIDCACVMTGQPAQPGIDIDAEIRLRGLQGRAVWLGHVAAGALRYLYEHAEALCFPSEFEGFGMPLVEAMECGCPVIATSAASIPEVVGDVALLIDGTPEAFADAIARVLDEPEVRNNLIVRGQVRARRFHPRRVARQTLRAIDKAASRFWQPRSSNAQAPTISYVIRPISGDETLIRTLASLAFEVRDHDEILVLSHRDALSPDAQILCENLGVVRYLPSTDRPDAWLDEVANDHLYYLQEGDWICEGATCAALQAFAEEADCPAVLGEVLVRGADEKLANVRYFPPRPQLAAVRVEASREERQEPPAPAVFWRTAHLRRWRHLLKDTAWPAKVLEQSGSGARACYRAFASTVEPQVILRLRIRTTVRRGVRWLRALPHRLRARLGRVTRSLGLRPQHSTVPTWWGQARFPGTPGQPRV